MFIFNIFDIRNSLQKKFIFLFVIIAVLPLLASSIFSFLTSRNILMTKIEKQNIEIAQALATELNLMVDARLKLLQAAAKDNDIVSMDPVRMANNVNAIAAQYKDMSQIFVADTNGQQVYRNSGFLINIADRPYFKEIKQGQPVSISDVLISRVSGKPVVILSVPLRDAQGKWVGMLSANYDMQGLSNIIVGKKIGDTGYAFVVDKTGRVMAHPNTDMVNEQTDLTGLEPVQKTIQAQSGHAYYVYDGAKKVAGYASVPLTNWGVVAQMPEKEALSGVRSIKYTAWASIVIVMILAGILGFVMARLYLRPINRLVEASKNIAAGNLSYTLSVDSQDEIGTLAENFNAMIGNLRRLVKHVMTNAETVAASAQQLSASAQESAKAVEQIACTAGNLAEGAQNQTREVSSTAKIMEDLALSAREVAAKAEAAAELTQDMAIVAQTGNEAVQSAVVQINEIDRAVTETADIVKELGQHSKEIGNIVEVITGIAGQTNLLALNAAIEAARAGEEGRGFAVVADEVRKLAEQSQAAAAQIAQIIGHIQEQTDFAVQAMDSGTQKVFEGVRVVKEAGEAINGILAKVGESVDMIEGISIAAEEQAQGSTEVVSSINNIAAIAGQSSAGAETTAAATEEATASMEEIAGSSQALAHTATELQEIVHKFQI